MASLVLVCRKCSAEAEDKAGEWGLDGSCADCSIVTVLAPYRVEMIKLWRKYSYYTSKGISVANQDVQIQAKFRRGLKKALDSIPGVNPRRAEQLAVQVMITEAQQAAAGFQRIVRA